LGHKSYEKGLEKISSGKNFHGVLSLANLNFIFI
jgi:hypothetical protein